MFYQMALPECVLPFENHTLMTAFSLYNARDNDHNSHRRTIRSPRSV